MAAHPDFDVLIIGAGLSGIGAARYLKRKCPRKSFAILEARPRLGGTWDLFRYPGIRSDSDMHTMGYAFKPWTHPKALADGPSIRDYIQETADENGLTEHIRFSTRVIAAAWDSASALWTVTVEQDGERANLTARFIFSCAGYYSYEHAYLPEWPGYDSYQGQLVHPQFWPDDLDYAGKRVAIIGSGATAVTLTPVLSETAAHVWQVQRSPTYVVSRPGEDKRANRLMKWLPHTLAYKLTRLRTILTGRAMRRRMGKDLGQAKRFLVGGVAAQLGDSCDWKKHFIPDYLPGQQRICMVPDGDMFRAIREKRVTMVTGEIERFTETGLEMTSGDRIDADIIVTATGLNLNFLGDIALSVDGQPVNPAKLLIYKGFMYSNIPNLIYFRGYTNASWTLKVDLVAEYACRLLKHMDRKHVQRVVPPASAADLEHDAAASHFISGYILRSAHRLPKHGADHPWIHEQDYFWDRKTLLRGRIDDGTLAFGGEEALTLPEVQRAEPRQPLVAE